MHLRSVDNITKKWGQAMKKRRNILAFALALLLIGATIFTNSKKVSAYGWTQRDTDWWYCRSHSNCSYITLEASGDTGTGKIYDVEFVQKKTHWPNAFSEDRVWSYTVGKNGYAKGKYTVYSSIITTWVSLSFSSQTDTITLVF